MSELFWMVAERLRRHPNIRIEPAVDPGPSQYPPTCACIARDDTGPFMEPHLRLSSLSALRSSQIVDPPAVAWQVTGAWQRRFGPD